MTYRFTYGTDDFAVRGTRNDTGQDHRACRTRLNATTKLYAYGTRVPRTAKRSEVVRA